jgi:hypothetical protein
VDLVMTKCAAPACGNDAPGRHGVFCVDHYFQLPKTYTGLLTRMKIECSRCEDADTKKHLEGAARRLRPPPCVAAGAPRQKGFFDE